MNPNVGPSPGSERQPNQQNWRLTRIASALALALVLGVLGILAWDQPAQAQSGPIVITKRVSAETVEVEGTLDYSITIQNLQFDLSPGLVMTDPLPVELLFVDGSLQGPAGVAFDAASNTIGWRGQLKLNESAVISYKVKLSPQIPVAKCGQPIINTANLTAVNAPAPIAIDPAVVPIFFICPDLGDAPDSTHHFGAINMTAYPVGPVIAHFPTVFDPATGLPQGPRHHLPKADAWLGANVSGERDADLLPDQEGVKNIDPTTNTPNRDAFDDGVVRWPTIKDCTPTNMDVQVNIVGPVAKRYLNVWIDWKRNGDWADSATCPGTQGAVVPTSEWVVQDQVIALGPGLQTVTTNNFLPFNISPNTVGPYWVRVTLSDQPVPRDPNNYNDGRGPATGYKYGETEDYIRELAQQPGEPHLVMGKKADVATVTPGGQIEYTIVVANTGTGPATGVNIQDPIPAGTTYVPGSVNSIPAGATYNPGPPARVEWTGNIPAGGTVTIKFKVQVNQQIDCGVGIKNVASIMGATGPVLQADALVIVECPPGQLKFEKKANVLVTGPGGIIEFTLGVFNPGPGPAVGVSIQDPIPAGTTYVAGSVNSIPAGAIYNPGFNRVEWTGNIPAASSVIVKFKVQVNQQIDCNAVIENKAVLLAATGAQLGTAAAFVKIECPPTDRSTDFGDAPDSDANHYGKPNTAYAVGPVLGHFPSVWDGTPATQGSGPKHNDADQYWLGNKVTSEKDADQLPDVDGITNILDNGANDTADHDEADDGWLNRDVPLINCQVTTLKVRISKSLLPPTLNALFLNVWFDGNRDGDWNDMGECPQATGAVGARSFEWIVQNWVINPAAIPAGGSIDIPVPTVLVHNLKPDADAWLRFTLSEQKAIPDPSISLPDGRGPATPAFFRLGETEDYYRKGVSEGQPGEIRIEKKADPAGPVNVGDVVNYSIILTHVGGTAPAVTTMQDVLPAGVALVSGPTVTELNPSAAPLMAIFNPGGGPNGSVDWTGTLSPNAQIRIDFSVRVRECVDLLRNVAIAKNPNGQPVQAVAETKVNCQPHDPGISLTKSVLGQNPDQQVTEADILPGDNAVYYLKLASTDGLSHTVHISDVVPSGLIAVATSTSAGVANIIDAGQTVVWDGEVGPANSPVIIKIMVRPLKAFECNLRLVNIANWYAEGHSGQSNPVVLRVGCRDLGDAPDSTNHPGAKMSAYAGVEAHYPTVFDVAAPERGPRHEHPRPFHLGKGVTAEVEADQGFDIDTVNNIDPKADKADQDKADDGLLLSTLSLKHCQVGSMKVLVSIDPVALALLPNKIGYLNVWLDSNRDGDWADKFDCPNTAGTAGSALEHIVIDQPINAGALGAGVHIITVNTTGPVFWPDDQAQKPAWLRLTLSDQVSNKPLGAYGDGRGYDTPFRLGETEDYLLRAPQTTGTADLSIIKRGELWPDYNPETQQRQWVVGWIINYNNLGPAPATNVHVVESYAAPQTLVAEHSIPLVPHTQSGNTLDYNVGTLPVGGSGLVIIRTAIPFSTTPGTVIKNAVVVSSANDSNDLNNTSTATVTVPILPPLITEPLAGTTCTNTVTVKGHAQPGVVVDLYIDGALAANDLPVDSDGNWGTTQTLPAGSHALYAIAQIGAMSSTPSPTVVVIVNNSLSWDPISLRFSDDLGHLIIPSGRLDESGWTIFLRPGHTYTVTLHVCCDNDPNAQVTMDIGNISVTLSDPDGDHIFTGTFTVPVGGRFSGSVRICVTCKLIRRCSDGQVTIDPEGTVFDLLSGQPVDSANVACLQAGVNTSGVQAANGGQQILTLWPANDFGQVNPQTVATDGYFSFFTPQGTYRLTVDKAGYQSYASIDLSVVDTPVHYDVPLTPNITKAADQQIGITDSGFEPAVLTVQPGAVIEWINAGEGVHTSTSITPSVSFNGGGIAAAATDNGGWDSGLLQTGESYKRQLSTVGTYTYHDSANPERTATIIVQEAVATSQSVYLPQVLR